MAAGKVLALISGIITLVATFLLSWVSINVPPVYYAYGIGIVKNLLPMFTNAEGLGTQLGIPGFAIYIIAGISIAFLASGILQLIGIFLTTWFGSVIIIQGVRGHPVTGGTFMVFALGVTFICTRFIL